jgi:hypothetical protein
MSRRVQLAAAMHQEYAKLSVLVPSAWTKFIADVYVYAAVMAWE